MRFRTISTVLFGAMAFALGVGADEAIRPTGTWWQRISEARRLGYVEGYKAGRNDESEQRLFCENVESRARYASSEYCVLFNLWQNTLLDLDTNETLNTISKFYETPANLPIRWSHAVVLSGALASGVSVSETQLQLIRREDAKQDATR